MISYLNKHIDLGKVNEFHQADDAKQLDIGIVNDLITNGIASNEEDGCIKLYYEDLKHLDETEYSLLNLPDPYPFDIYVDIIGTGLKDKNLKLKYSFQDFAHGNGSGNQIFRNNQLVGAYLKGESEYLLNSDQYLFVEQLKANSSSFSIGIYAVPSKSLSITIPGIH